VIRGKFENEKKRKLNDKMNVKWAKKEGKNGT
jgi:hypothetical protein